MHKIKHSDTTKKKISDKLKGRMPKFIPNNKGRKRLDMIGNKLNVGKKHPHSIETIEKIKLKAIGRKRPDMIGNVFRKGYKASEKERAEMSKRVSGEKHPLWGKHRSEKTKIKLRAYKGEKASAWQGGKS